MRGHISFLFKDSFVYGLAGALNRVFTLVTFPLLTRYFSVADYGTFDLLNVFVLLFTVTCVFGQDSAVARYFFEYEDEPARQQVVSQSLVFQSGITLALLPLFFLLPLWSATGRFLPDVPWVVWLLIVAQVPFFTLVNFSQNILKWTFRRNAFLLVSVGSAAATLVGVVVVTGFTEAGLVGVFLTYLVVRALAASTGLLLVRGWIVRPEGWRFLKEMLPYALPLGVVGLLGVGAPLLERSLVLGMMGQDDLGLFAAGAKVAMLLTLVVTAFQMSWGPFSLSIHKEETSGETYNQILVLFSTLVLAGALTLTALGTPILRILASERYVAGNIVIFALAMGVAFQAMGWITELGSTLAKNGRVKLASYFAFLAILGGGLVMLIPRFGLLGGAWAALVAYGTKAVIDGAISQWVHPMPWRYGWVFVLVAMAMAFGIWEGVSPSGEVGWRALGGAVVVLLSGLGFWRHSRGAQSGTGAIADDAHLGGSVR